MSNHSFLIKLKGEQTWLKEKLELYAVGTKSLYHKPNQIDQIKLST